MKNRLTHYLTKDSIFFLDALTRKEVIEQLLAQVEKQHRWVDPKAFHQAILDREQIVSTSIGLGVAIPHARIESCKEFFVLLGILKTGVEWEAVDHLPIRLVFLVGGPEDKPTEYLQLLSEVTMAIKEDKFRKELLQQTTAEGVFELLSRL